MDRRNITYNVELYCVFKNVNSSILMLNQFIQRDGYIFTEYSLKDLEDNFSRLFHLPRLYDKQSKVVLKNGEEVSRIFFEILRNHPLGGFDLVRKQEKMYFLKKNEMIIRKVENGVVKVHDTIIYGGQLQKYSNNLVRKLRYFKNGDIFSPIQFEISEDEREIESMTTSRFIKPMSDTTFTIENQDLVLLENHLALNLKNNELIKTAEMYFEAAYQLPDWKAKYTNLFMALESIFNRGKDQITHVVARHLSILISETKDEFEFNYKKIKELYGIRSSIVHGQKIKFKTKNEDPLKILQDYTRIAIIKCSKMSVSKDELFAYLNMKGFTN